MTFDVHQLDQFVLVGSAVTILAILAVRISSRAGLPSLLIYLAMGVALGEKGLGIQFDDAAVAQALGFAALALILAEGGLTTSWRDFRPSMPIGLSLATIGVAVSIAVMAVGTHYLLGLPWELAVLLGAVTSPTDAAAVFSVLRAAPIKKRLSGVLEAESGLNDAPTVVLVTLISSDALGEHGITVTAAIVGYELLVGVGCGLLVGFGGSWLMRRAALPASGLYPIAVLTLTFLSYGSAAYVHASGFAAVYVAALVLGNSELPHRGATRSFAEGVAWLAQIGLFVMLGLLLTPSRIDLWATLGQALVAGLVLTVLARPISVLASSVVRRMPWRDVTFLSWAGLRGAVPIVLMTIPLAEGVVDSERLFDVVFVMVVLFTLLTGPTLPLVARRLGVDRRYEPRELDLEAAPLERIAADLLQVTITPASRLHGVEVGELRLPEGASVSMLIREGRSLVPERRTVLKRGDDMLVVTPRKLREATERRLRDVSLGGRLGRWLTEE
ncbi:potassium/proton antiporter [Nocardioides agariphilus]|uniref:Potassium/proton antiporter n=1 Tax=Nocardioides agariphilus TaxID=433664 RepID=A0A930VN00_9ACTN|nr:potassium/proton antiporter [Nocardioides agariphilus]